MAELVGDAYIRITADTTVMKRALKAQMKEAGKDGGKAFSDEVEKQSKGIAKGVERDFAKAFADPKVFDRMAKQFDSVEHAAKDFNDQLDIYIEQGKVASKDTNVFRNALKNWETQAKKTRDAAIALSEQQKQEDSRLADRNAALKNFFTVQSNGYKRITAAQKEQARQAKILLNRDHAEALQMRADEQKAILDAAKKEAAEHKKFNDDFEREEKRHHQWLIAEAYRMNGKFDAAMNASEATAKKWRQKAIDGDRLAWAERIRVARDATDGLDRVDGELLADRLRRNVETERRIAESRERIGKAVDKDLKLRASSFGRGVDRLDATLGKWSNSIGKAFGKGKRNNFVNLFGGMVGAAFRMAGKIGTALFSVAAIFTDTFSAVRTAWKSTQNVLDAAGAGIMAFGKGVAKAGPAILAAVGALFVFGEVLPAVVAGLSLLLGAVVATTSAISYGLVGALLAVGPAAAGALLGLGGVFLAVKQFASDKANKQLMKEWFEDPQKNWAKNFKVQARSFLSDMHEVLHVLLDAATPAVKAFFKSWDDNMKDASTKSNGQYIVDSLSRIATTLNTALPQALSGIIGFFRPIMPYAEQLATWLGSIATRFDTWANGEKGQNQIADFMKTAWADAHKVWQILVDIKDIIFEVFEQGEPVGGGILDGVHSKLREIVDWLRDPKNDGKIKAWFASAGDIAVQVGELAGHLGGIVADLNDEKAQENAKNLMGVFNGIAAAAGGIMAVAGAIGSVFGWLEKINTFFSASTEEGSIGGWIHDKIYGKDKKPPKPIVPDQLVTTPKTQKQVQTFRREVVTTYRNTLGPETPMLQQQIKAIDEFRFKDKTIPIKGNEELWAVMRDTAAAYVFAPKQILVGADTTEWDAAKGTAQGFVFDTKNIKVEGDTSGLQAAIANAKHWLSTLPASKRIRIAGVTQGGVTINAAGGMYDKPTLGVLGEAGPEAIVPLNRPLSMVDPAVRSLSAFAQGLSGPKGLPAANTGPRVQFTEGAIQVNLPTGDPKLAAEAVLDRLVAYIG